MVVKVVVVKEAVVKEVAVVKEAAVVKMAAIGSPKARLPTTPEARLLSVAVERMP